MKLKQRVEDFRVRELLEPGVLVERGEWRVYRVIKRKLTSLQAAEVIAREAHCAAGDVSMCGFKDRQGVTTQHMAVHKGPQLSLAGDDLRVEGIGFAREPLDSKASTGNAFDVVVRGLEQGEIATLRRNLPQVRDQGLIDYFDDQRFGNLRHGQGWIALDLMRGEAETALQKLLASSSIHDDERTKALKRALRSSWGDWGACRDIAGKFGAHHSVFEYLKKHPDDFAGAFYHVSSRVRLIHLYAYQSHLWNRAVVALVRERTESAQRIVVDSEEGPLVYPSDNELLGLPAEATFPLPGPELEGVTDEHQRELLADVLAADRLVPAQLKIEGISGFQLKPEPRPLFVVPAHLRVRPPRPDPLHRGLSLVEVRFELPRGAYATLVVRRLLGSAGRAAFLEPWAEGDDEALAPDSVRPRAPRRDRGARPGGERREPRGDRSRAAEPAVRPDRGSREDRGAWRDQPRDDSRRPRPTSDRDERRPRTNRPETSRPGSNRPGTNRASTYRSGTYRPRTTRTDANPIGRDEPRAGRPKRFEREGAKPFERSDRPARFGDRRPPRRDERPPSARAARGPRGDTAPPRERAAERPPPASKPARRRPPKKFRDAARPEEERDD